HLPDVREYRVPVHGRAPGYERSRQAFGMRPTTVPAGRPRRTGAAAGPRGPPLPAGPFPAGGGVAGARGGGPRTAGRAAPGRGAPTAAATPRDERRMGMIPPRAA